MLQYQKKWLCKALSILLAAAMLLTSPIGNTQAYAYGGERSTAVDSQGELPHGTSGVAESSEVLDSGTLPEEPSAPSEDTSGEPAATESDGYMLMASPAFVWPEGSSITVKYKTQTEIAISWSPAKDDGEVVDYLISVYQGSECIVDRFFIGTIPEYTAYNLSPGVEYRFDIQAMDLGQYSEILSQAFSTSSADGNEPPFWHPKSSLATGIITSDTVELMWAPALDDKGVTDYQIYQEGVLIETVPGTGISYTVIGLLPSTTYTFKVEAVDNEGLFTTDGPETTVTTKPGQGLGLRFNTTCKNINGDLFMGDKIELEFVSIKSGLTPIVAVSYKEWNAGRTAVEDKTRDIILAETQPGSKKYIGDFELTEGICEITALEGKSLTEAPDKIDLSLKVAGRLKVAMQEPSAPDELSIFNQFMDRSTIGVYRAVGGGNFTVKLKDKGSTVLVEGLSAADDYTLQHHCDNYTTLYQTTSPITIKAGLETEFTYKPEIPSYVKLRAVDNITGKPIRYALISAKLTLQNGKEKIISAMTGEDGYAVATGDSYFSKNVLSGSTIELSASHLPISRDIAGWYEPTGPLTQTIGAIGHNEVKIEMKKVELVTLRGTVTDEATGKPLKRVYVSMYHPAETFFCYTDANGQYTMQVVKNDGEVSFGVSDGRFEKKPVKLNSGDNTLDITMQPIARGMVKVKLNTIMASGVIKSVDMNWMVASKMGISVKNTTNGKSARSLQGDGGYFEIEGKKGDTIEVTAIGGDGYGKGSVTAVLDRTAYAEVTLDLKEHGRVVALVTDQFGDMRQGETRYINFFKSDGTFLNQSTSTTPHISYPLPEGSYKAVISWKKTVLNHIVHWRDIPECVIIDELKVSDGVLCNLGTIELPYSGRGLTYFQQNKASSFVSSHKTALPGTVVTLRADYDYKNIEAISEEQLSLVAYVPQGAELINGSVIHKVTSGGRDIKPDIGSDSISINLSDRIASASGSLTYQVKIGSSENASRIRASAELKFTARSALQSEKIGAVSINTKMLTLNAPLEISKTYAGKPVRLSGIAAAGSTVELYDGDMRIGEQKAAPTGLWSVSVTLPDRGAPIFHILTAKMKVGAPEVEHSASAIILVGTDGVEIVDIELTQGSRTVSVDPRQGVVEFPFVVIPKEGDFLVKVRFDDAEKAKDVKISGYSATRQGDAFVAHIPYTTPDIIVAYNEKAFTAEDILKYDHGQPPSYITEAEVKFTDAAKTEEDVKHEFDEDGYLNSLDLPAVTITMGNVNATVSMKLEQADFDPANAKNRTLLGNEMYGYDFSYELAEGKYVITAYLDRRLLPKQAGEQRNRMMAMSSVTQGLNFVKTSIEVYSEGESLIGAFGDLSKSAQMAELLLKYERVRPNLQPHMAEYYDARMKMMGQDILMGKTLGQIGEGVGNASNFVPLVGQVVTGIAGILSGKLLGDMFDNEFNADYSRINTELSNMPGGREPEETDEWIYEPSEYVEYFDYDNNEWRCLYFVERGYTKKKSSGGPGGGSGGDSGGGYRGSSQRISPKYVYDPSGYVYEAVADNRIEDVTATVLYLPKDKAVDTNAAKASTEWEFWNAEWYLQKNPQITDAEGRYAWDVPEGWWMVQFVKDGYQTTYSDALPVPPPQLDVNVPMVKLNSPKVEKTVWGSGGRYVDIYFSKYMDMSVLKLPNAVSITDVRGDVVSGDAILGSIKSAVPEKTGVKDLEALNDKNYLNLTKVVRFTPASPLEEGKEYNLTVNKAVTDYAGFSMEDDYAESQSVPASALIKSLSGKDIGVELGKDITQAVKDAVSFIADDPAMENSLDKRLTFTSSHDNVVRISDNLNDVTDAKIFSIAEGTAKITATSVDDTDKKTEFIVTVKYPPVPIGITRMTILDASGKALTTLELHAGDTYALNPSLFPANTTQKTVTYSSDNEQVVTVSTSGVIKAVSKGIATITVMTENLAVKQNIHITVLPARPEPGDGGSIVTKPTVPAGNGTGQDTAKPAWVNPFTDVKEADWFYNAVKFIAEKGITNGTSATTFSPNATLTRGQFITMLLKAYGIEPVVNPTDNFADAGSTYYTGYLATAKTKGISNGVGNNKFAPEQAITRQEMFTLLYNALKVLNKLPRPHGRADGTAIDQPGTSPTADNGKTLADFTDSGDVASWATEAITALVKSGVVSGSGGKLNPTGGSTRAQMAQVLYNLLGK